LQQSAEYFSFSIDPQAVHDEIFSLSSRLEKIPHKVRVMVNRSGTVTCQGEPLPPGADAPMPRVCLAPVPVNSSDPFLYHKTTNRSVYNNARAACPGYDDVILWNEKGEITESCIANIVVEMDDCLYTPPVSCGLLPGTFRAFLLAEGRIRERIILRSDLPRISKLCLINSVRKMREVALSL